MANRSCVILFIVLFRICNGLECEVIMSDTYKNINEVITTCLIPTIPVIEEKVDNSTLNLNVSTDDDPEEPRFYGPRRGLQNRTKRQDDPAVTTTTSTTKKPTIRYRAPIDKNDPKRCVVHCIFKQYNMLDAKGFPEITKISTGLVATTSHRELKDFLQDMIDECFFEMSEIVEKLDNCTYSARLITCLAGKGRENCADWPVGELPFPHLF